jgi:hypothetical protein
MMIVMTMSFGKFFELQNKCSDKMTVYGHETEARLVSRIKFFVGDAVLIIELWNKQQQDDVNTLR